MPSGRTHAEITLAAAGLTYAWGIYSGDPPFLAAAAAGGCVSGVLFNPDLDVIGTRADRFFRDLGMIPAILWGLLWYPYSTLIPHRSILSHGLIMGTLIRIAYIMVPLYLLGLRIIPAPEIGRAAVGLLIADNLHIGADYLLTGLTDLLTWLIKK